MLLPAEHAPRILGMGGDDKDLVVSAVEAARDIEEYVLGSSRPQVGSDESNAAALAEFGQVVAKTGDFDAGILQRRGLELEIKRQVEHWTASEMIDCFLCT